MADMIKILICDDNEDTREGTRRLLEYEDDIEVLDFAEDGREAVQKVREYQPRVVLMDINMPGMNGIEATQIIRKDYPNTQVIVVSVQDDMNYVRSAMRAGAVDFVPKPISGDELTSAIRRAASMATVETTSALPDPSTASPEQPETPVKKKRMIEGRIVTVASLKGGTGKTTVAVNLAAAIKKSAPDKDILIVDTNVYAGDVAVSLNTRAQYNVVDAAGMALESELDEHGLEGVVIEHDTGIRLLTAPPNPLEAEPLQPEGLRRLLNDLRPLYDYIIVDTSTAIDGVLVTALQSADHIVMITQANMSALKDSRILSGLITEVEGGDEVPIERGQTLVLNRYDAERSSITPEQIGNFLKLAVNVVIPIEPLAEELLNRGTPIVNVDPKRSPAAQPLMKLAQHIRTEIEGSEQVQETVAEPQTKRTGLFSNLLGGN